MEARMADVYKLASGGHRALEAMESWLASTEVPQPLLELVRVRASQINGCGLCVDYHSHRADRAGERAERLWSVAAWREAPYYTAQERAALALTEAMTRLADSSDGVPDHVWEEVAGQFSREALAALVMAIASVNAWNRVNVATRQLAGWYR
ncbi:carboxymuconolactone decarboxylase family protein [Nonomuraea candida]|uniref:carboxymuconolactone decarboxylase family protein n=1 Tax=Nonomuraea candida TaxID=359159 RepID=UPI0005BD4891|nr:carboxymuconolactone decarboxylase family protein [Nonomuraea candida]